MSLPTELEDLIPEVEDFYKKNHSGRKLHWHHLMSNGIVSLTDPSKDPTNIPQTFSKLGHTGDFHIQYIHFNSLAVLLSVKGPFK